MKQRNDITKKILIFFLIATLIIYIEPQSFKEPEFHYQWVDWIYKMLKLSSFFIFSIIYVVDFFKEKKKKIDSFIVLTFLSQIFLFIPTVINGGDLWRYTGPAITVIHMALMAEYVIRKKLLKDILLPINIYFAVCFVINLISMIIIGNPEPNGEGLYFLGWNNRFIYTFFPWIICIGLSDFIKRGKITWRYYLVLLLIESILVYKWSVSAMIAMGLFAFVPLLTGKKVFYRAIYCINILINFVITCVGLNMIAPIKYVIVDMLHKDMTFTGRTYMWNGVYKSMIRDGYLFGHGVQKIGVEEDFMYSTSGDLKLPFLHVPHAHNSFVSYLYRGGILALISYAGVLFVSIKSLGKNDKNTLSPLLVVGYVSILVLSLFDTIDFSFLFFFFGICYYCAHIETSKKTRQKSIGLTLFARRAITNN